jgi:hypothetical protein
LTVNDSDDPAAGLVSPPETVVAAGVVPVAVRVNWSLVAVPPLSLVRILSNTNVEAWSSLVMVQVTCWFRARATALSVTVTGAPVTSRHTHAEGVYPAGPPDSDRV